MYLCICVLFYNRFNAPSLSLLPNWFRLFYLARSLHPSHPFLFHLPFNEHLLGLVFFVYHVLIIILVTWLKAPTTAHRTCEPYFNMCTVVFSQAHYIKCSSTVSYTLLACRQMSRMTKWNNVWSFDSKLHSLQLAMFKFTSHNSKIVIIIESTIEAKH